MFRQILAIRVPQLTCFLIASLLVIHASSSAWGHSTDETYIWLNPQDDHFDGRVELRLNDLRRFLKMEVPEDYPAARDFIQQNAEQLKAYVSPRFSLQQIDGTPIEYSWVKIDVLENEYFGHFAQLFFKTETMEVPPEIVVSGSLLFEFDKYSRCLLCMEYNKFTGETHKESFHHAIFSPWNPEQTVDFNNIIEVKKGRRYFIWEGIRHIWIGIDHILFLVTLLLASVLVQKKIPAPDGNGSGADETSTNAKSQLQWVPVEGFREAFWNIFKIVTVFTIAHSITLCLASLGIVNLPSRLVESVIALSILIVAINNIFPTFRDRTWIVLFMFGLFHGLGFASVMQNLPFRMPNLTRLMVCFNIGVELGQMAIVAIAFPFIYALRKTKIYQPVILVGGSIIMSVIAGYWFIERAMGWA